MRYKPVAAKKTGTEIVVPWLPQPRQARCLQAAGLLPVLFGHSPTAPEARVILYGGAAGGGKTDALLAMGIIAGLAFPGINIGFFRREYPDLEGPGGAIQRSFELMSGWAKWKGDRRRWTLPTGSVFQFCHAKEEKDVYGYQSQQFDVLLIDEATHFSRFMVRYLLTRNRATRPGVIPFAALATNPGNVGHLWALEEFVDAGPPEQVVEVEVEPGEFETHIFIPAKLSDNQILEKRDPGYRKTLQNQPEAIRRQLLDGDWTVGVGTAFKEWRRDIHVVEAFPIPRWWKRWIANDIGYAAPFAWYWFAASPEGQVYVYREYYGTELRYSDQARNVVEMSLVGTEVPGAEPEKGETGEPIKEKISFVAVPHDAFRTDPETGKNIADYYHEGGLRGIIEASADRKARKATLHEYLKPYPHPAIEDRMTARLQVFRTCRNLIRTLPACQTDPNDPEKVDNRGEDHAYDAVGYGLQAWHPKASKEPPGEKSEIQKDKERLARSYRWRRARLQ